MKNLIWDKIRCFLIVIQGNYYFGLAFSMIKRRTRLQILLTRIASSSVITPRTPPRLPRTNTCLTTSFLYNTYTRHVTARVAAAILATSIILEKIRSLATRMRQLLCRLQASHYLYHSRVHGIPGITPHGAAGHAQQNGL